MSRKHYTAVAAVLAGERALATTTPSAAASTTSRAASRTCSSATTDALTGSASTTRAGWRDGAQPTKRADRIVKVQAASAALPAALRAAQANPDDLTLWAAVEELGATIHRQSRLLAGKSKGG